jgi:putative membrane protein
MGTQDSTVISSGGGIGGTDAQREAVASPASIGPKGVVATRASRAWLKVLPALLLLAVILLFIFENSQSVKVSFVSASGRLPLAIALLAAAALGGLIVLALGSIRILQLRKVIHSSRRTTAQHRKAGDL